MAKDDISICNIALSRIGISLKIASLTERTKEAIELNNVFEEVRDRVLSAAPWPFARKFQALQKTGTDPFRWLYRYEYPNDCVAIRNIYPPFPPGLASGLYYSPWSAEPFPSPVQAGPISSPASLSFYPLSWSFRRWLLANPVRYEISLDDDGAQTITTDQDEAVIEYTARVTNPRLYDAKFTGAFAWALAAEVALSLAKTVDYARNAASMYEKEVSEAIAKALNEETRDAPPDSEFVRARW